MNRSDAAANYHQLTSEHGDRLIIGIGVSHGMLINMQEEGKYRRPLARMSQYLDGIDAATHRFAPTAGCSPPWARRCSSSPATEPAAPTPIS